MSGQPQAYFAPCDRDTWRDPFEMYRALRDHDPVHYRADGDYWALSRFEHVHDAAVNTDVFSSAKGLTFTYGDMEAAGVEAPIVMLDPPEHTQLRALISKGFTPRKVAEIEPEIRSFVIDRIERMRATRHADVVAELLKPLPSMVVADYLGVPRNDRALFDRWTDAIVAANAEGDALSARDAVQELFEYFGKLVELRRREPGDDSITILVHARDQAGDGDVSLIKVLGFAFTMITGGNDTTTGLLGGALESLTTHRDQREMLRNDPSLIPNAVEEFLRLTSPVQGLARTTTRDVTIDGTTIPAGKKVMLLYGSANRDEREFGADASACNVAREIKHILSFSVGPHYCLGAAAARLQARVVLEELLARCPGFTVDAGAGRFAPGPFVRRYDSLPFRSEESP